MYTQEATYTPLHVNTSPSPRVINIGYLDNERGRTPGKWHVQIQPNDSRAIDNCSVEQDRFITLINENNWQVVGPAGRFTVARRVHNATKPLRYKDPFQRITHLHAGLRAPGTKGRTERSVWGRNQFPTRIRLDGSSNAIMQIHLAVYSYHHPRPARSDSDNSVIDKRLGTRNYASLHAIPAQEVAGRVSGQCTTVWSFRINFFPLGTFTCPQKCVYVAATWLFCRQKLASQGKLSNAKIRKLCTQVCHP